MEPSAAKGRLASSGNPSADLASKDGSKVRSTILRAAVHDRLTSFSSIGVERVFRLLCEMRAVGLSFGSDARIDQLTSTLDQTSWSDLDDVPDASAAKPAITVSGDIWIFEGDSILGCGDSTNPDSQ
jgi:hypothetical protein